MYSHPSAQKKEKKERNLLVIFLKATAIFIKGGYLAVVPSGAGNVQGRLKEVRYN